MLYDNVKRTACGDCLNGILQPACHILATLRANLLSFIFNIFHFCCAFRSSSSAIACMQASVHCFYSSNMRRSSRIHRSQWSAEWNARNVSERGSLMFGFGGDICKSYISQSETAVLAFFWRHRKSNKKIVAFVRSNGIGNNNNTCVAHRRAECAWFLSMWFIFVILSLRSYLSMRFLSFKKICSV